jgi:DNA repair ATPase RecN
MDLSPFTESLVRQVDELSHHTLAKRDDLALLIELARLGNREDLLDDLAFLAKFLTHSRRIMQRIGPQGEGYERLASEFSASLQKSSDLLRGLTSEAPEDERARLSSQYLDLSPNALENFLALLSDLSWYKNWRLDHPE